MGYRACDDARVEGTLFGLQLRCLLLADESLTHATPRLQKGYTCVSESLGRDASSMAHWTMGTAPT
jgi:hypothetical protein